VALTVVRAKRTISLGDSFVVQERAPVAYAGEVLEHPVTGERVRFLQTARDTGGHHLLLEVWSRPTTGGISAAHVHPRSQEAFEVLSGMVRYRKGPATLEAGPGERFSVPQGVAHTWHNAGDDELHMRVEFRPAGRMEAMFENLFGLAADGKVDRKGLPAPFLQLVVLADEFLGDAYLARPPLAIQRPLFGLLTPIGRWRGYQGQYDKYCKMLPPDAPEVDR
jgi:quercetin dioxygenase-like cupin family protein